MVYGTFNIPERQYAAGAAFLRGQGQGRIVKIHGVDEVQKAVGNLVVDFKMPQVGATPSTSYEGDGFIVVRHAETRRVEEAVTKIISTIRVDLA